MPQTEIESQEFVTLTPNNSEPAVAYFCMEYCVDPALPIYSGGLGVVAGDILKAARDLSIPFVGVGLFYRNGYFSQRIGKGGWQEEQYPAINPSAAGLKKIVDEEDRPVSVIVPIEDRTVATQAYVMQVGTIPLILLTTDVEGNSAEDRMITAHLYGAQFNGDTQTRLRQEMVLGIGGNQMLDRLGFQVGIYHMNEGHSAFLTIARVTPLIEQGLSLEQALKLTRPNQIFTSHTPVPAANDIFPDDLLTREFAQLLPLFHGEFPKLQDLANHLESQPPKSWSQTKFAMACASKTTAVSRAYSEISARVWHKDEVPYVTNGVHISWMDNEIQKLIDPDQDRFIRRHTDPDYLRGRMEQIDSEEFTSLRNKKRRELVTLANEITGEAYFDPDIFTIAYGRRAATYKRLCLPFQDPDRLGSIIEDPSQPAQIIMAAKADPHDDGGKEMIQTLVRLTRDPKFRRRALFIPDYNSLIAKKMVVGSDLWLNVPIQDAEASGTSGMKSGMNGGLQWSVAAGWMKEVPDELYFRIEDDCNPAVVAGRMYEMLAKTILPRFYSAGQPLSEVWVRDSLESMEYITANFSAARMLHNYRDRVYQPILNKQ